MLSVDFMAIDVVLVRKSYVLFEVGMIQFSIYGPKSLILMLPALCTEIWTSFGILYCAHCAGFAPINLGRHCVSDSKLHFKMM